MLQTIDTSMMNLSDLCEAIDFAPTEAERAFYTEVFFTRFACEVPADEPRREARP
jgi:hypothetical protein